MLWGLTPEELYPYDWGKECTHMAKNNPVKLDASFEEQMQAEVPATPMAEQRDIEKNYGGDERKASDMQAFEQGLPTTRAFVTYVGAAEAAWKNQKYGFFPPIGLAISAARLYEVGRIAEVGVVTGTKDNTVNVRVETEAGFKVLADMVTEHRKTGPVSKFDLLKELDVNRQGSALATIEFLRGNNRGVSFAETDRLVAEAREVAKATLNAKGTNFRPAYDLVVEAVAATHAAVNGRLAGKATTMADSVSATDEYQPRIVAALSSNDQNASRKTLLDVITELRTLHGAQDPDWKPRDGDQRRGMGNQPDRGRSNGYDRKRQHVRGGNRF